MEDRNIFKSISPLDHRYYLSNKEAFEELSLYLSEEASIRYCIKAEVSLVKAHLKRLGRLNEDNRALLEKISEEVTPDEVYAEEEKTRHNIRALVNTLKSHLPEELASLVHMGATSVDILDTAQAMRIRDSIQRGILPRLIELEKELAEITLREKSTPQVGRTHGQHAVPITVGFAFAEYTSRLGKSIEEIHRLSLQLKGKLAGAVGAYNATSLIDSDPSNLEKNYLDELGLEASEHSTQMVEPEYLLRLLLEVNVAFGIIANLADDLRHLQRSEINELREYFASTQVGSSTMPQKRNPWNSEHVKSLWKAFSPRVMTFYMDQISEHQRDLSNSASMRFISDYLAGFTAAVCRMKKILTGLSVVPEGLQKNLSGSDMVLAEAAYILLAVSGGSAANDAHEIIRKTTLACEKNGSALGAELKKDPVIWKTLEEQLRKTTGLEAENFFKHPELYRGIAAQKAETLGNKYLKLMNSLIEKSKEGTL